MSACLLPVTDILKRWLNQMSQSWMRLFFCGLQIKQMQDGERKQLTQLRDVLKASLQSEQREVSASQRRRSLLHRQQHVSM